MTIIPLFAAALAVLPADRLMMADRLFDRGDYARAEAEYVALEGEPADGLARDELLYRLAECRRAAGDAEGASRRYSELLERHPLSRHAERSRLMRALSEPDAAKRADLKVLDDDRTSPEIRAAALYHLGVLDTDADCFRRCVRAEPKGRYALAAKFRHGELTSRSEDAAERRTAIGELMEVHFSGDAKLAREALYLAAVRSYETARYGEAASLFRRYLKVYADDARADEVRRLAAWSDYRTGRYATAAALCGEGKTDDTAYLLAACAYASGDKTRAAALMRRYLADWPQGRYRSAAELPLARLEFEEAEKTDDTAKTIEAARRSAALSGNPADRLRLGWAYEKAGREKEALAEYAAIATAFPKTEEAAEALFRKAMADIRAKRWSAAELALAESLASGAGASRRAEALFWRGLAAHRLEHVSEACGFLKEALEKGLSLDHSREARLLLADADFLAERSSEARAAYAQLVREGAAERMSAAKKLAVGRFLLSDAGGEPCLDEAKACGRTLVETGGSPEWRQAGYALLGEAEEAAGAFSAAAAAYAKALAEKVRTECAGETAYRLGVLCVRSGDHAEAERALTEAVRLSSKDNLRRCRAYLWLAKNSEAMTDYHRAAFYATYVTTLFDEPESVKEAERILREHPEEGR